MRRRFIRPWMILVLVVIVLCAGIVRTYFVQREAAPALQTTAGRLPAAVAEGAHTAAATVSDFFGWLLNWRSIYEDNAELQQQIAVYQQLAYDVEALREENACLTELLGSEGRYRDFTYTMARVTSHDTGSWLTSLTLDAGSRDGLAVDMPVVTGDGLVGRITEVAPDYAVVTCMTDSECAVSAVVRRTRDEGVVLGSGEADADTPRLRLMYLPFNADVVPGDEVVTGSLGGIYPQGLPIGTVVESSRRNGQQQYAIIEPAADFGHIQTVLVITGEKQVVVTPAPATPTPTPAASPEASPAPSDEGGQP